MPELILYNYWRSSASHRVRIALALKAIEYTYIAVDLSRGENAQNTHATRSPTRFVPCLTIDGVPYIESVAIVELLEERFPEPRLHPDGAHHRARVRALVEIVNSGIQPFQNLSTLVRVAPDRIEQTAWAGHFIDRGLQAFEAAMEANAREGVTGRYAYGDDLTVADAFLVPQVHAATRFGVDLDRMPRVRGAFEAAEQLDAVKRAAPDYQPDAPKR